MPTLLQWMSIPLSLEAVHSLIYMVKVTFQV